MYRKDRKNEFYTEKARKEGYPARSVYKLKEIVEKYNLIKKGDMVLDLGCAPGSWLLYISEIVGKKGKVVGVDIEDIKIRPEVNILFIKKDVREINGSEIESFCKKYQVVVSDLAPETSGIKAVDTGRCLELSERAFELAKEFLAPGGNFICKTFEGEFSNEFFKKVSKYFQFAKRYRPKAVIKGSREFYIIAKKYDNKKQ